MRILRLYIGWPSLKRDCGALGHTALGSYYIYIYIYMYLYKMSIKVASNCNKDTYIYRHRYSDYR